MPKEYNAESEIVVPAPQNAILLEAVGGAAEQMEFLVMLGQAGAGQVWTGGLELGIELALADPDAARKILVFVDSAKAADNTRDTAVENAKHRRQLVDKLIDAANGIQLIAPPQTGRNWVN